MSTPSSARLLVAGVALGIVLVAGWATLDPASSTLPPAPARSGSPADAHAGAPPGVPSARPASAAHAAESVPPNSGTADEMLAPDFTLPMLAGGTFRLSEHRGRVVVINFWATWCPPCREEIPDFIALQKQFGSDVVFVGVSLDDVGADEVRAFADGLGVNYPVVIDDGTVSDAYGPIPTLPTTFLVGRDGTIQGYAPRMLTRALIEPPLANLVAGRPVDAGARGAGSY